MNCFASLVLLPALGLSSRSSLAEGESVLFGWLAQLEIKGREQISIRHISFFMPRCYPVFRALAKLTSLCEGVEILAKKIDWAPHTRARSSGFSQVFKLRVLACFADVMGHLKASNLARVGLERLV